MRDSKRSGVVTHTGDIVKVDSDGYVFILGRLKRFAKVSGEMVSLAAVEEALAGAFPQYGLRFAAAVVARLDAARGERLIAVTNEPKLTLVEVRAAVYARGLSNLAVPRDQGAARLAAPRHRQSQPPGTGRIV